MQQTWTRNSRLAVEGNIYYARDKRDRETTQTTTNLEL